MVPSESLNEASLFTKVTSVSAAKEAKHAFARSTFSWSSVLSSLGGMLLTVTAEGSGTLVFAIVINSSALEAKVSLEKDSCPQSFVPTQQTTLS